MCGWDAAQVCKCALLHSTQTEVKEIKADPANGHKVGSGGICPGLLQTIANQRLKAAPSPEVRILNPILALKEDANVAVV